MSSDNTNISENNMVPTMKSPNVVPKPTPVIVGHVKKLEKFNGLVEEADFKSTRELFGGGRDDKSLDNFIPKSESDFLEYAELISHKLQFPCAKKKQLHVDKPDDDAVVAYDAYDAYDFM
ncbi:uncharacterized protein LOC130778047 [Actinidia eriantha]|uniref:uncharacterized protein LOC130778047 n=1 Tax=Actinidia eriantha TaxID=165200 RepID=UPI0025870ACF|nr:uncharacterized protein LOC130778047 [Actinidia eriantha]